MHTTTKCENEERQSLTSNNYQREFELPEDSAISLAKGKLLGKVARPYVNFPIEICASLIYPLCF